MGSLARFEAATRVVKSHLAEVHLVPIKIDFHGGDFVHNVAFSVPNHGSMEESQAAPLGDWEAMEERLGVEEGAGILFEGDFLPSTSPSSRHTRRKLSASTSALSDGKASAHRQSQKT